MKTKLMFFATLCGVSFLVTSLVSRGAETADTIYHSGSILTEQYDEQATKGTLEAGKLADLVFLDKDPLKVDSMTIKNIRVLETIKEGVTIYPAAAGAVKPLAASPKDPTKTYSWRAELCDLAGVNQAAHKEWTLTTLNGKEVVAEKPPTMKFEHGKLDIFGGINRLTGSYALVDDTVTMGSLVSTKMAGDPALMELESNLAKALASVDAFQVSGNQLTLSSKGNVVAKFRSWE